MEGASSLIVPNFLQARSLLGLRRLCLKNNISKGKMYKYFDFQYDQNTKKYICFYEEKVNIFIPNKLLEEGKEKKVDKFLEEFKEWEKIPTHVNMISLKK